MSDFGPWMSAIQARTETALEHFLPHAELAPQRLHQAMRYAVLGGGKRVRPLLAHAAGELSAAQSQDVDAVACAVEMIHAYSLVHDDMPCMDDDVLRRGKPTCHVAYDEATALLVGDALQTLAFQVLAEQGQQTPDMRVKNMALLAHASGSRGMAGGQAIDLGNVGLNLNLSELEFMHIHKTGALIRAALLLGAGCGHRLEPAQWAALDHFAKRVGLLFQVVDDILDVEASTTTLGKTAGKDAADNKPTYVSLLGLHDAKAFALELQTECLDTLQIFSTPADRLRQLTEFIVSRRF